MKKYFVSLAVVAFAAAPALAHGATFVTQEEYSSGPQERIAGNLYVAASGISVASPVVGDVLAVGGNISLTGTITGDVTGGGATVQVLAPVQGDVRVGAGQFTLNSRIGGDLVVFGGTVHILADGVVAGGVYVLGGQVTIDGTVNGPLEMRGGRLTINGAVNNSVHARLDDSLSFGPNARVSGTVGYKAPQEATVADGARIGSLQYTSGKRASDGVAKIAVFAVLAALTGLKLLMALGLAALLVWRWRRPVLEVLQDAHDQFWGSAGHGVLYGIGIPLAGLVLLVSIVGTFAGAIVLALFGVMAVLAKVMAGMFLGAWLWKRMRKTAVMHLNWPSALCGVILLELVDLVPILGALIAAVLCLAVFGALARRVQKALF